MELIIYTPDMVKQNRSGEATIRVNRKACFTISKGAAEALGLNDGDAILLAQDKKGKEWYILKNKNGFKLRRNSSSAGLAFNCTSLANIFLDSCNLKEKSYLMKVATQPTEIVNDAGTIEGWAILTSSAK